MDDRLTISFGSSGGRPSRVGADSATVFREADDATRSELVWRPQEGCDGFGEGHRYRLIREIGRGGMGAVYEGWDAQLCRSVAIKLMDDSQRARPAGLQRFFREARIASRLSHPGIVTIHEFGVTLDGQAFIVMELLRGQTLRQVLADVTDRAADLPSLVAVFSHVCEAMASAHDVGIIHRDLKPSNIMVCSFGVVSVMDWGVAKLVSEGQAGVAAEDGFADALLKDAGPGSEAKGEPETSEMQLASAGDAGQTLAGTVFGTPAYLAPEQARGEISRVGRRSDVFGLGSILCEILSGAAPFAAASSDDRCRLAAAGAVGEAFDRLENCGGPLPLVALAKRCLAADPHERPADAQAVASAVRAYLESGQRRAEQELVRFFDLSLDLFCIAGLNGSFRRLNDNAMPLLGYRAEDLASRPFMDLVHPDDRERTRAELASLAKRRPTIQFVNRYRHADGHYVWLEWNARAVPEEAAVYAVARDVSDRVAAADIRGQMERERETLAAFGAAAALFLTAPGSIEQRLADVAEEGVLLLGLVAMEIWRWEPGCDCPQRLASAGRPLGGERDALVRRIASDCQPQQILAGSDLWESSGGRSLSESGIGSFLGYPLLLAGRPVGVLAAYASGPLSQLHVTAMSSTLASLTLALSARP